MSLEDRFRQSLATAIEDVKSRLDADFQAAIADARAEAEAASAASLADARAAVEAELRQSFATERDGLTASHETLLAEEREVAAASVARLREEAAADLARVREEGERALATLREESEATAARLRQEADTAATRLQEEIETARGAARAEAEAAVAEAVRQREAIEAEVTRVRDDHSAALEAARTDLDQLRTAHANALDAAGAGTARLLESVRGLDGAISLTEILDALTTAAAREAGRAAVLVVKGERLIGWRASGFGAIDAEPRRMESGLHDQSALAAAVETSRPVAVTPADATAPAFAPVDEGHAALAVPLMVGGRAVAVVYSGTGDGAATPAWEAAVELLVRHAGRCLEAMTVQRAAAQARAASRVTTPA